MKPEELKAQLAGVRDTKAIVVLLVDLLDASGSFLTRVRDLVGSNPVLLIGTKVLYPSNCSSMMPLPGAPSQMLLGRKGPRLHTHCPPFSSLFENEHMRDTCLKPSGMCHASSVTAFDAAAPMPCNDPSVSRVPASQVIVVMFTPHLLLLLMLLPGLDANEPRALEA